MTGVALIAACGDGGNDPSNVEPTAAFTYACSNLVCTFTDQSSDADGSIDSRSWDFGDGGSGTNATQNHTYASAGTYQVKVEATDNGGKSKTSAAQAVIVTAGSATVQADFDVTCAGSTCTLDNTSAVPSGALSTTWAWDFGDQNQTSTDEEPGSVVYTVSEPTTFTIILVVTSDGVTSQATKQVHVAPAAGLTCNGVACTLDLLSDAKVTVTLTTRNCEAHGNTFVITQPDPAATLFTDGCFTAEGTSFDLNNGEAYTAGTSIAAEVRTGVAGAENPQLRVTGTFATGWTLEFDDGFVGEGEPDFNDLVITVVATPQ
jgi:PKD repeat protein